MARVTVEDCVEKVPNRFELVVLAAQRARHVSAGAPILLERDNDKNPVVALREIVEDKVEQTDLKEALVKSLQKHVEMDDGIDDVDLLVAADSVLGESSTSDSDEDDSVTVDAAAGGATMGDVVFEDVVPDDED